MGNPAGHPLAGFASVEASAARIRTYRWLEERLMRILGGWIALTPELPVKLLFGRHVWDCAQHADLWGRRLPELRAPAHRGEPPSEGFARLVARLDGLQRPDETVVRLVSVYRVLKPHLIAAYERHLAEANPIYEPPTRRILVRCLQEERRHVAAGSVLLDRLTASSRAVAGECECMLMEELGRVEALVSGPVLAAPLPAETDLAEDLVALDSVFDPADRVGPDLAPVLDRHARALMDADDVALGAQIVPSAREAVLDTYRVVGQPTEISVVACARVGAYRFTKLALRGPRGLSVVQLEWRRGDAGWQIVAGALIRSEPAA